MARIEEKNNMTTRVANWYTRRSYGRDTEIAGVMAHSKPNFRGYGMFEFFHERSKATDPKLLALAGTKAACMIGCEFCLDIGSHISLEGGRDRGAAAHRCTRIATARRSRRRSGWCWSTPRRCARRRCSISDELFARLQEQFTEEQLIELTTAIAIENFRARFNSAMDITPAGFTEGQYCAVPQAVAVQEAERTSA